MPPFSYQVTLCLVTKLFHGIVAPSRLLFNRWNCLFWDIKLLNWLQIIVLGYQTFYSFWPLFVICLNKKKAEEATGWDTCVYYDLLNARYHRIVSWDNDHWHHTVVRNSTQTAQVKCCLICALHTAQKNLAGASMFGQNLNYRTTPLKRYSVFLTKSEMASKVVDPTCYNTEAWLGGNCYVACVLGTRATRAVVGARFPLYRQSLSCGHKCKTVTFYI